jgi:excisionase family DNA binding protein
MPLTKPKQTFDQVLHAMTRQDVHALLRVVRRRQADYHLFACILESRLASLTSSNGHADRSQDELLKIPEVCKVLRVTPAYAYELVRQGALPSVKIPGEKGYVRVSRASLNRFVTENVQKRSDRL